MLLRSVNRAWEIEDTEPFKGKLQITHRLTTGWLSKIHRWTAIVLYVLLMAVGIYLAGFAQTWWP